MAHTLAPLYRLLQKATQWTWGKPQQAAFQKAKAQLTSEKLLIHYDPSKELLLSCNGIGAVLSHSTKNGIDQPIAFASRSLSKAEKRYAHLEHSSAALPCKRFVSPFIIATPHHTQTVSFICFHCSILWVK